MKLRALGVGWACLATLGVGVALVAPTATTGCQTHQCDFEFISTIPDGGFVSAGSDVVTLDPATGYSLWESSPIEGEWRDFPGNAMYGFGWGGFNFRPIGPPSALVATDPSPYAADAGGTYVVAGGQLAEFSQSGLVTYADGTQVAGGLNVENATCAHYYVYVSVYGIVPPPQPPPPPPDAGNDTGTDAPGDASGDGDAGD